MGAAAADKCVIALDVGGTTIKAGAVARDGRVLHRVRRPTNVADGPRQVVGRIEGVVGELAGWLEGRGSAPLAVGVAVPGLVDEKAGIVHEAGNIGWHELPLRGLLASKSSWPLTLQHDVRAGGIAEGLIGAARGVGNYLFMPIGTGIAGAVFVDGHVYTGVHALAGEIGHIVVEPGGSLCVCGNSGCLETVASAQAIAKRYTARTATDGAVDGAEVVRRLRQGDEVAVQVWREAIQGLATALLNYTLILSPELVVIGGGLAAAGADLVEPLAMALGERMGSRPQPRLVCSELGDEAGCLGAAIAAFEIAGVAAEELDWSGR